MLNIPRRGNLLLSKGAMFDDYRPSIADDFPADSTCWITCYDSSGTPIATLDGTVTPKKLSWLLEAAVHDPVPNGAQYEMFIQIPGAESPYKYEYGSVIRREASFYTPPASSLEGESRLFIDTLGRSSLGRRWIPIVGGTAMHDLGSSQYGMGPDVGLLFAQSAVRYFRPLGGDSFRAKFSVASTNSFIGAAGTGKLQFIASMDTSMTTGMGFEIETGVSNKFLHTGLVTGPVDLAYTGSPVASTTVTGDSFTVDYSDLLKVMRVFKGLDTDPIIEWEDTGSVLPHGPGFRHWGFAWDASLIATGPLLLSVEAQDYV